MAKIIFKNGTEISAEINGNCFVTNQAPEFPDDLSEVTVQTETEERTLIDVSVQECASVDGKYWFTFLEKTPEQKEKESLLADIEAQAEAIVELAELIGGAE